MSTDSLRAGSGILVAVTGLMLLAGCSRPLATDYSDLNLVDVSGRVTLDDEPLAGATVLFEAEDQTYSYGRTDDTGYYKLMFNSEQPGVIPGRKTVRITMGSVGEESDAEEDEADGDEASSAGPLVTIPERYNRRSELAADVSPQNRVFNFDLKSN